MGNQIRLLNASDSQMFKILRIASLHKDPLSWHSSIDEEEGLTDSYFANKIHGSIYPPLFGYYGFFENNDLLAYAQIAPNFYNKKRHIATLYDVVVSEKARRKSVGTKLIQFIINEAKSINYIEQLHLKVNSKNIGAIKFYIKLGFKKIATIKDAVKEKDGSYQDEHEFTLKI